MPLHYDFVLDVCGF